MTTTPPAMPPAMGPMEELLLEAAGGEGAATAGLRSATGTVSVTGGKPSISTTTLTDATFAPTPAGIAHHMLKAEMAREEVIITADGDACSAT